MSNWFVKNLGEATFAEESLDHIKGLFLSEYEKANRPNDMALFMRHESEGRLHCEVKIYFSPAAHGVANSVQATPCRKPSIDGLEFLARSNDSWFLLFIENNN